MLFDNAILTESKSARESLVNDLDPGKIKTLFTEVFGDVQFIGDEITKQELIRVFGIDESTATKHVQRHEDELRGYGYRNLKKSEFVTGQPSRHNSAGHGLAEFFAKNRMARSVALFHVTAALAFGLSLDHPTGELLREAVIKLVQLASHEDVRRVGKAVRRTFTDVLRQVYDTGAPTSLPFDKWASNFTVMMTTKVLGISKAEFAERKSRTGNFRDTCTAEELEQLEAAERVVVSRFHRHGAEGIKALYHDAKDAMEVFA